MYIVMYYFLPNFIALKFCKQNYEYVPIPKISTPLEYIYTMLFLVTEWL